MEFNARDKAHAWWQGAWKNAVKGIPQGVMLGVVAAGVLFAAIAGMMLIGGPLGMFALHTAQAFGGFLYSHSASAALAAAATPAAAFPIVTSLGSVSLLPIVLFNTVLTSVGNFLTGGDVAVAEYKGKIDHLHNEVRIRQLEGREQRVEQALGLPQTAQKILVQGPQSNFAAAEDIRVANNTGSKTIQ